MRALRTDPVFLALAVGTIALHLGFTRLPAEPYGNVFFYLDGGYRLYPSVRLMNGEVLFRDFFTVYTPVSYWLHWLAFEVLGVKMSAVRLVLVASQTATTLLTYAVARRLADPVSAGFAALLTIAFGVVNVQMGFSGWYVVPLVMAGILALCRWIESGLTRDRDLLVAGILGGIAASTKLRDGALVAIASVVCIVALRTLRDFAPGRGRPRAFHPLYALHLLLPAVSLFVFRSELHATTVIAFVLPAFAVSGALAARQVFFTTQIDARPLRLVADLTRYGAGFALPILPWLAWYSVVAGPAELWSQLVTVPLAVAEAVYVWRENLRPDAAHWILGVATLFALTLALRGPAPWRRPLSGLATAGLLALAGAAWLDPAWLRAGLVVALAVATGCAALLASAHPRRTNARDLQLVVLAVFAAAMPLALFPMIGFNHWVWTAGPACVVAGVLAARVRAERARHGALATWATAAALAVLVAALVPEKARPSGQPESVALRGAPRGDLRFDRSSAAQTQAVIDFLRREVPEGDAILEIPGSLYAFLGERRQAARTDYFYGIDGSTWDEAREIAHLERIAPEFALLRTDLDRLLDFEAAFPRLSRFVREHYAPYARIGRVDVLRRRGAPAKAER
jgi:hypothetical protein